MGEAPLTGSCSGNMLAAHLPVLPPPRSPPCHSQRNASTDTWSLSPLGLGDPEGGHGQEV